MKDAYGAELDVVTMTHNFRADRPLADLAASLRQVLLSHRTDDEKRRIVRAKVAELPLSTEPINRSWLDDGDSGSRAILTRTNGESLRVLTHLFGTDVEGGAATVRLRAGNHESLPPAWIAALLSRLKSPELTRSKFGVIFRYLTREWDETTCRSLGLPPEAVTWSRLCTASDAPQDATRIGVAGLRSRLNWPDAFPDDQLTGEEGEDGVVVTTIHQSKGLEFDVVTVLDTARSEEEDSLAGTAPGDGSGLEEANVHYVAVTRAARELNRADGKALYLAPRTWTLQSGRARLCHWRNGWMNVEVGLGGDLDPFGFVDPDLHGGSDAVATLQAYLLRRASTLQGHKVMLLKRVNDGKAVWDIHIQMSDGPGLLVGRTAPQMTHDLLDMLHGRGYALPNTIMNLRIAGVGTVASDVEFLLDEPYRTSRLWLGVSLFGTGDFRTYRRKR